MAKLYCGHPVLGDNKKIVIEEINATEKPKTYVIDEGDTAKTGLYHIVRKEKLGTVIEYSTVCFGLTKEEVKESLHDFLVADVAKHEGALGRSKAMLKSLEEA